MKLRAQHLRRLLHPAAPVPPVNVRLVHDATGRTIPVDLVYDGYDADGLHVWKAVYRVALTPSDGWKLSIGMLPARTTVHAEMLRPD